MDGARFLRFFVKVWFFVSFQPQNRKWMSFRLDGSNSRSRSQLVGCALNRDKFDAYSWRIGPKPWEVFFNLFFM